MLTSSWTSSTVSNGQLFANSWGRYMYMHVLVYQVPIYNVFHLKSIKNSFWSEKWKLEHKGPKHNMAHARVCVDDFASLPVLVLAFLRFLVLHEFLTRTKREKKNKQKKKLKEHKRGKNKRHQYHRSVFARHFVSILSNGL